MLQIKHLTKRYAPSGKKGPQSAPKIAVDNLSLTISAGEIYGFIGHNGAGKTTTLKAAMGLIDFDEGEITVDGHSIKTEPTAVKRVTAYIPDNPDLYLFLTGAEYLNFVADFEVGVVTEFGDGDDGIRLHADVYSYFSFGD